MLLRTDLIASDGDTDEAMLELVRRKVSSCCFRNGLKIQMRVKISEISEENRMLM